MLNRPSLLASIASFSLAFQTGRMIVRSPGLAMPSPFRSRMFWFSGTMTAVSSVTVFPVKLSMMVTRKRVVSVSMGSRTISLKPSMTSRVFRFSMMT